MSTTSPDPVDEVVTPSKLAQEWETTEAALAQLRSRGRGPKFIRAGARRILYRRSDIRAFLDARTVTRTGEQLALFDEPPRQERKLAPIGKSGTRD
jgi:hypothetical protein